MEKCKVCGADYDIVLDKTPLCAKHYVEREDKKCLKWDAIRISDDIKTMQSTDRSERILKEIMKKHPNILSRENEFGECLREDELVGITERFRRLKPQQVDVVYHRCGYIFANHGASFKALRKSDIDAIFGDFDKAKEKIWDFLAESRIDEVRKALDVMENRIASFK